MQRQGETTASPTRAGAILTPTAVLGDAVDLSLLSMQNPLSLGGILGLTEVHGHPVEHSGQQAACDGGARSHGYEIPFAERHLDARQQTHLD